MKTIFRPVTLGLLMAAIIALGAAAGFGQDACADTEGQDALYSKFLAQFPDKTIEGRKTAIDTGKQYVDKYGTCESVAAVKTNLDYFKDAIPKLEETLRKMIGAKQKDALTGPFDAGLKAKNWDVVYANGKQILALYPDEYRTVEIVLGSIGGEEAFKNNFKYTDDTLKYAKLSIADLEAGKPFVLAGKPSYGLSLKDVYNFGYANKDEAIGYLNLYIGYITLVGQKNKVAALPYLYKATQAASESAKQPIPFELIGGYYFDELNKLVEQIQIKAKDQKDTDAPDVAKKKIDDIKALVAMSNGTSERAIDAFARAYNLGKDPAYKAKMKKNVEDAYKLRFNKTDGVDAWIAAAVAKPFINPTTPVAPISDPEPVVAPATTTTPAAPVKPGITPVKPPVSAPIKPAKTPGTKPQAVVKKPIVKKKGA